MRASSLQPCLKVCEHRHLRKISLPFSLSRVLAATGWNGLLGSLQYRERKLYN
jgi:hypothetical protein